MLVFGLGIAAAAGAVLIMVLYLIHDAFGAGFYRSPLLLWSMPAIMFLWLGRVWLLAGRNMLDDDPLWFAVRDNVSLALGVSMVRRLHRALGRSDVADLTGMAAHGEPSVRPCSGLRATPGRGSRSRRSAIAAQAILWSISEPADLFSDFYKAYYPGRVRLLDEGAVATWETTEAAAVGFVNLPILAWLFAPLGLLDEPAAGWAFLAIGAVAVAATYALLAAPRRLRRAWRRDAGAVDPRQRSAGQQPARRQHDPFHLAAAGRRAPALARRRASTRPGLVLGLCALFKLPLMLFGLYVAAARTMARGRRRRHRDRRRRAAVGRGLRPRDQCRLVPELHRAVPRRRDAGLQRAVDRRLPGPARDRLDTADGMDPACGAALAQDRPQRSPFGDVHPRHRGHGPRRRPQRRGYAARSSATRSNSRSCSCSRS